MIKKALLIALSLGAALTALAFVLYVRNPTPYVPPISTAEAASSTKPYVVKLHAQWCPVCMTTKTVWAQIDATYSARANLVAFDFTNEATSAASKAEATRLGLDKVFEENAGWTGTVLVIDGRTREVTAAIHGSQDFAEYRTAIDTALGAAAK
jgi:thiol-disulfide isomerase/thioredoxin